MKRPLFTYEVFASREPMDERFFNPLDKKYARIGWRKTHKRALQFLNELANVKSLRYKHFAIIDKPRKKTDFSY